MNGLKKSAEMDDSLAQFMLGSCFEDGEGVDVDLVQAMHWYEKSAAQGEEQAIVAVERLHHSLDPNQ